MAALMWVLMALVALAQSRLVIYKPNSIAQKNNESFPYTIANFGHIPYGKSLIGRITLSKPGNLCEPDPATIEKRKHELNMPYFLIGERGTCKFTTKALNAQKSGASLAIIEDTNNSESGRIVMANDGFGFQVDIPSIFISYDSGEKLKRLINESNDELIMMIKFDTERSDTVLLRLWLDASTYSHTQTTGIATSS